LTTRGGEVFRILLLLTLLQALEPTGINRDKATMLLCNKVI
jgi:hypothetical protein